MQNIDKSLAEQLQIGDREIAKRKALLDFTEQDAAVLKSNKFLFEKYIDGIVKQFYDHQSAVPEIALVIGDAETLRRLQQAMHHYILELFEGNYDAEYVNRRLRIGKVHKRIGVSPKLYISAIYILQKILKQTVEMQFHDEIASLEVRRLVDAINKIMMFDIQLVFDTYISSLVSEVETAKEELEVYAQSLEDVVAERTAQLSELASKDELTGLYNQRGMYDRLRHDLAAVERYKEPLSLAYFDLNSFKKLNDTEGHKAGDKVLQIFGRVMLKCIRELDSGCRYGGDEFCMIMPRTGLKEAKLVIERFVDNFKQENNTFVSFSVGIVSTETAAVSTVEEIIKRADECMYRAKELSTKKPDYYICMDEEEPSGSW